MSDMDTLLGIAEWAAYHAHGNIFHSVISMINEFNSEGIETHTNLYQRSKFFSVVERLDHINYLDSQSFSDVVTLMDELQNTWGESLLSKGIHQFKWLNHRHEIIAEMGIGLLRIGIGFEGGECSGIPDDIPVASSFSFKEYKESIKELFQSHRKYLEGSSDSHADIETEDEMIDQSTADLCDILIKPKKKKNGIKYEVSKVKLRILLDKHSLKKVNQYVLDFVKHIQELVLPIPALRLAYESHHSPQQLPESMRSPDWTDEQRRTSGPYAQQNSIKKHTQSSVSDGDRHSAGGGPGPSSRPQAATFRTSSSPAASSSNPHSKGRTSSQGDAATPQTLSSPPITRQLEKEKDLRDYPIQGTLTKVHKDFNMKIALKDPLPGILFGMGLPHMPSRISHRRSSRIREVRTSPRKMPVVSSDVAAEQGNAQREDNDGDSSSDEILTEDQESLRVRDRDHQAVSKADKRRSNIAEKMELSRRATEPKEDTDARALNIAFQQKRQLHELDHYTDHAKPSGIAPLQFESGHGQGAKKQRLIDSRPSATRVIFNDTEEMKDEIGDDSDESESDFHQDGVLQKLKRAAAARDPERREHPVRLERVVERVMHGRRGSRETNPRRKWTIEQECALENAVEKHGFGNWAAILEDDAYRSILKGRSNVNLKDKYRNMLNEK